MSRRGLRYLILAVLLLAGAIGVLASRSCGCGSTVQDGKVEVAGPREVDLLEQALQSAVDYDDAVTELERTPERSLLAVRQAGAKPGTRRALLLQVIEDRLKRPGAYGSWRKKVKAAESGPEALIGPNYAQGVAGLDGSAHALFWAERLLVDGRQTTVVLAAQKLRTIGGDVARRALRVKIEAGPGANLGFVSAADALAALGAGGELADGLAVSIRAEGPESLRARSQALLRSSLGKLPPTDARRTSTALLKSLATQPLDDAQRRGYLQALTVVAAPDDLGQLAALRRAPWASQFKDEIDAVIAAVLGRQASPSPSKKLP